MKKLTQLILPVAFFCSLALPAHAEDMGMAKKETSAMSKEQREKMAMHHDKMSACLRSDKSMADCREEMKKSCADMGEEGCPMMGKMMGHKMDKKKAKMKKASKTE